LYELKLKERFKQPKSFVFVSQLAASQFVFKMVTFCQYASLLSQPRLFFLMYKVPIAVTRFRRSGVFNDYFTTVLFRRVPVKEM